MLGKALMTCEYLLGELGTNLAQHLSPFAGLLLPTMESSR